MIFDVFSRRKIIEIRGCEPEVYRYDVLPEHLRYQLCIVLSEGIGAYSPESDYDVYAQPNANDWWVQLDRICRKELFSYLPYTKERDLSKRILSFVSTDPSVDDVLSIVEICCFALTTIDSNHELPKDRGAQVRGVEAIKEINGRFEQHGVDYQFENKRIIRIDSKMTHAEIIKPALALLTEPILTKANDEFMRAHSHYRATTYKDSVTASNRAFESALKAICDKEGWTYGKGDTASDLITKVTVNGLFTRDFDRSFTAYVAMLKAGLPAIRNDAGGHGEGLETAAVTAEIARFALNLTATNLVFLGESYALLKKRQAKAR